MLLGYIFPLYLCLPQYTSFLYLFKTGSKAAEDYQEILEIAAKNCDLETIKSLVKNSRDASKEALYYSAEKGCLGVVKFLLDERVDGDVVNRALFNAVEGGQLEVVKLLLKRGANPHVRGWKGKTPKAMAIKWSFYNSGKPYREIIDLLAEAEKRYIPKK